ADGQVYTTRYVYDGASRRVASLQQSDGSRLDFGYVQVGSDYRIQTVIDVRANGVKLTTRFDYDAGGGRTTVTDAAQQATQLDYADDRLVRVSGGGIEQRYVYDKQGRVSDVTDGRGQATRYEYDATGNRISRDEGRGRKTTWRYGAQNQLLSEATSGGGTARQIHDAGGTHVRFSISAEGRVIERRYDSQGREACRIAYQGGAYLNAGDATREADLVAWAAKQDPKRCERLDTRYDLRGLVSATVRYATLDAKGNGVLDGKESHSRFVYDQAGNLLQKLDGGKGTVLADYVYDGLNRVTRVKDASGDVTTTVYGDASRQTRIALGNGLTTITQYDAEGRELSVLSQDAGGQLGTLRTEYNAAGLPVKLIDANGVASYRIYDALGRKTGEIDAEGALTELRYNAAGQLFFSVRYANRLEAPKLAGSAANWKVEQLRPASDKTNDRMEHRLYDTLGQLTQIIDAEGGVVRHEYDAAGRLLASTRYANRLAADRLAALAQASGELNSDDAANRPVADAANDRVSRQFYDRDGLLLASVDGEGYLTEQKYDSAGHVIEVLRYATRAKAGAALEAIRPAASGDDQRVRQLYDGQGRLLGRVDAEGYLEETVYDARGRLAQTVRYANRAKPGDALDAARPASHAQDRKVVNVYDDADRLQSQTRQPDGLVTRYRYDGQGRLIETTRVAGNDSRSALKRYDSQGRVTQELAGEGAQAIAALGAKATGQQIDAVWSRWGERHYYNAGGQRIATLSPDGQGGAGRRTLYYYDGEGRLSHTLNSLGEVRETRYNVFGEAIDSRRYATRLSAEQLAKLNGGASNVLGNFVSSLKNAADGIETNQYNRLGQRVVAGDSLTAERERWEFNAFGEVSAQQSIGRSEYLYDRAGRETQRISDAKKLALRPRTEYDAFGRAIAVTDAAGRVARSRYDKLGRQIQITDPLGGLRQISYDAFGRELSVRDALGRVTTTVYDDAAGRSTVTHPLGVKTISQRNAHGETVQLIDGLGQTTTYQYNRDGALLSTASAAGVARAVYDSAGQKIEAVSASGVKTIYRYDAAGRQLSSELDPGGLKLVSRTEYDAQGRVWRQTDPSGRVSENRYDANSRLKAVVIDPNGLKLTTAYDYDAHGQKVRVTEAAGRVTEYEYDGAGRRVRETVDPKGLKLTTHYQYDAAGNVVAKTDVGNRVSRFVYDGGNQLRYSVDPLGYVTEQRYDAAGQIVQTLRYAQAIPLDKLAVALKISDLSSRLKPSAGDQISRVVYDDAGRAAFSVDASGYATRRVYDAAGHVVETRRHANRTVVNEVWIQTNQKLYAYLLGRAADSPGVLNDKTAADPAARATALMAGADFEKKAGKLDNPQLIAWIYQTVYNRAGSAGELAAGQARLDKGESRGSVFWSLLQQAEAQEVAPNAAIARALSDWRVLAEGTGYHANDQVTRQQYDAAGRVSLNLDAAGYLTSYRYDAAGSVTETRRYAQRVWPEADAKSSVAANADWADYNKRAYAYVLGRAPANLAELNARAADFSARAQELVSSPEFEKLHGKLDDAKFVDWAYRRIGLRAPSKAETDEWLVNFSQKGLSRGELAKRLLYWRIELKRPASAEIRAAQNDWSVLSQLRASPQDQITRTVYDAAGRAAFSVDAAGYATRRVYDEAGNVVETRRYANRTVSNEGWAQTNQKLYAYLLGRPVDSLGVLNDKTAADPAARATALMAGADFEKKAGKLDNPQLIAWIYQTVYNRAGSAGELAAGQARLDKGESRGSVFWSLLQQAEAQAVAPNAGIARALIDWRALAETSLHVNDQITRQQYDAAGRVSLGLDAAGYLTGYRYDAAGNVTELRRYAQRVWPEPDAKSSAAANADWADYNKKLYAHVLGRAPASLAELNSRSADKIARAQELVASPEFEKLHGKLDDSRFITLIYQRIAGWTPGKNEMDTWLANFAKGDVRGKLVNSLMQWRGVLKRLSPIAAVSSALNDWSVLSQLSASPQDQITRTAYDKAGRVSEMHKGSDGAMARVAKYELDAYGNRVKEWDGNNHLTSREFDALGRVHKETHGEGDATVTDYDAFGNAVKITDPRGNAGYFYFDALGRRILQVDPEGGVTRTDYDALGNARAVTRYVNAVDPATLQIGILPTVAADAKRDAVSRIDYDALGRQTKITDAEGGVETMTYDAFGNKATYTNQLGAVFSYDYDAAG
ncbi:DUF4214 domain-containing protein, partial [Chromobacterium vaccinii]|uniref:DUF4214 domain-containing protein n=1 Tax=Chromobacterium vaccinii TaxID=1108595 RepID=UPI0032611F8E